jgi:hypothetical protein
MVETNVERFRQNGKLLLFSSWAVRRRTDTLWRLAAAAFRGR